MAGIPSFGCIEIKRLIPGKGTCEYPLVNTVISSAIGIAFGITLLLKGTPLGSIDRKINQILVIILSFSLLKIRLR